MKSIYSAGGTPAGKMEQVKQSEIPAIVGKQ